MSNYLELYFDTLKKSSDFRLLLIPVSVQEKKKKYKNKTKQKNTSYLHNYFKPQIFTCFLAGVR